MVKQYFKLILLAAITMAIPTKVVRAEMVLYCTQEFNLGFILESGVWISSENFRKDRFIMKVIGDWDEVQIDDDLFSCFGDREFQGGYPKICKHVKPWLSDSINIDKYSLRFVYSSPSMAGYALDFEGIADDDRDTDNLIAGKCEKF